MASVAAVLPDGGSLHTNLPAQINGSAAHTNISTEQKSMLNTLPTEILPFRAPPTPISQYQFQAFSLQMEQVQVLAESTFIRDNVIRSAQALYQSTSFDLKISTAKLERFANHVSELKNIAPDQLKDYLLLIELLDELTPESMNRFFEDLEAILSGESIDQMTRLEEYFLSVHVEIQTFSFQLSGQEVQQSDPLVLDLDDDGIEIKSHSDGRQFDINADGRTDQTAFVTGGDAFLALDRNQNGTIDDGSELFGDQNGAANGYQELRKFDDNNDGTIDKQDSVYNKLLLFNGKTTSSLSSNNIAAIPLANIAVADKLSEDSIATAYGSFVRTDGSRGLMGDLLLGFK